MSMTTPTRHAARWLVLLAVAGLSSCSYVGMVREKRETRRQFEENPTPDAMKLLLADDCFVVTGQLSAPVPPETPMAVVAVMERGRGWEVAGQRTLMPRMDAYSLFLPAGSYRFLLLADLNGNGSFDPDEVVGEGPARGTVDISAVSASDGAPVVIPEIDFDLKRPRRSDLPAAVTVSAARRLGFVESLADPVFDPEVGELGVFHPGQWMKRTQGLFFRLGPVDLSRDQVVFVHGILGTPRDFHYLVDGLDRQKLGIWFYYYPSGMPLDKLGLHLAVALRKMEEGLRPTGRRVVVVAHSMGGLVSRRALEEVCREGRPPGLAGYVSFASPYGGVESAARSLKAPEIAYSWRDIVPGSDFLSRLHARPLPPDLPFHLFFGWGKPGHTGPGVAGDGTIALGSQLDPRVQFSAARSYGYGESHVGILENPEARAKFLQVLEGFLAAR